MKSNTDTHTRHAIYITLLPAVFLLTKLNDIMVEAIHHRAVQQLLRREDSPFYQHNRRKASLIQKIAYLEMGKKQEDQVPPPVRSLMAWCKGLFGLFFLAVGTAHLIMRPTGCDGKLWAKGCVNKIPFCKSLFAPTCNCASLRIENDYS